MMKQILFLVGLTIVAVIFQSQLAHIVHFLLVLHNYIANELGLVFSSATMGHIIQGSLALIAVPLLAGLVALLVFWAVKHQSRPHIVLTIWIAWLVMLVTMLAAR